MACAALYEIVQGIDENFSYNCFSFICVYIYEASVGLKKKCYIDKILFMPPSEYTPNIIKKPLQIRELLPQRWSRLIFEAGGFVTQSKFMTTYNTVIICFCLKKKIVIDWWFLYKGNT